MSTCRRLTLKLCAALAVSLAAAPAHVRGQVGDELCPAVRVQCPDTVVSGQPVTFLAEVAGGPLIRPTFKWTLSGGAITSGQGTSSITVDTTGFGGASTATVEVGGFRANCDTKVSCSTTVSWPTPIGCRFDSFGDIKWKYEQARLDNFAIALQNEPGASGQIICYGGRRGPRGEAEARCDRAKNYLVGVRGLDHRRVVTLDGGFRERSEVVLWIVPAGAVPPQVAPTVDPEEVEFVGPAPRRKRRAPRRP